MTTNTTTSNQDTIDDILNDFADGIASDEAGVDAKDSIIKLIEEAYRRGEEDGYLIGWNACVDDCPDKMKPLKAKNKETQ